MTPEPLDHPTPELLNFLERSVWGGQGLQYHVRHYASALKRLPHPRFFTCSDSGRIISSVTFFSKRVLFRSQPVRCVYLTQLSVDPSQRGKGIANQLVHAVVQEVTSNASTQDPVVVTAYIDEANAASRAVFARQGFTSLGQFQGIVFNRLAPKQDPHSDPLAAVETQRYIELLTQLYEGHSLQDFPVSLKAEDCWVLRDSDDTVVAGVQVHHEEWQVTTLEGIADRLILRGIGRMGWFKRFLFDPQAIPFLHMGNLYVRPGKEDSLYRLMESLVAKEKVPFGVMYLDTKSPLFKRLSAAGSFGFLNHVLETRVVVVASCHGIAPEELLVAQREPLVISPLDIS